MKKSAIVILSKIVAIGLIFIAPMISLLVEYTDNETQVVEVTTSSMPTIILIIISLLLVVFIAWLGNSTMAAIHDHPFGFGSIYMFGSIILGLSVLAMFWLSKLDNLINYNVTQFLSDILTYKASLQYVIAYMVAGLVVATAGFIYQKTS